MNKFKFLDWKVYQDSRKLFSDILSLVNKLPREFRFEMSAQLIRSCSSIALNIAEGSGKSSDKELNRFLNIAIGSLYETLACLDLLRSNNFITDSDFNENYLKIEGIGNQLGGFKRKIKS